MSPDLERRLRDVQVPDEEEARARARRVVLAATPARDGARRRRHAWRALAAAAGAAAIAVAVVTPPGEAVGSWVKRLIAQERPAPRARPALTGLPAPGRLLVTSPAGAWVVNQDGARRRLGPYEDAAWSPRGLFVAVTRGRQLLAVEPGGAVRWALARPHPVADPRWSSEGFRIAYRAGGGMRVVAGDGSADRLLVSAVAAVPAAWRPGPLHEVTLVRDGGALETWSADRGTRRWRRPPGPLPIAMRWTPDGRRLIVVQPRRIVVLSAAGRAIRRLALPEPAATAAIAADGARAAVASATTVRILHTRSGRAETTLATTADSLTWSPTGRRLLVASGDQWVFLPVGHAGHVTATADIGRQFDPSKRLARGPAHVQGWAP